jgi:hypothetical protein
MFIFTWVFDKLGYMPKINMEVGKVNFEPKIPDLAKPIIKKPIAKKTTTVAKKATRKPRVK